MLSSVLQEEEKIANAIADSVTPFPQALEGILGFIRRHTSISSSIKGLRRMLDTCRHQQISMPKFEELDHFFRVTLYPKSTKTVPSASWQEPIFQYLQKHDKITAKIAQEIWQVTRRTTTTRLKEICQEGLLIEISTSPKDPQKVFVLPTHRN
ncbi:MAG: hypothetical protein K9M07_01985 [Simkaniaceae bacterium]|nr:hypothetical protein [Simkaniaceae bacterium]MCF7851991.1 hypothetical protein [Simkaniaceae bacterium]